METQFYAIYEMMSRDKFYVIKCIFNKNSFVDQLLDKGKGFVSFRYVTEKFWFSNKENAIRELRKFYKGRFYLFNYFNSEQNREKMRRIHLKNITNKVS